MPLERAHAGELRERVRFTRQSVDANGIRNGPWEPFFECAAKIEASPAPSRIAAQRLEGESAILVTVRYSRTLAGELDASMRMTWLLNGLTYQLRSPEIHPKRAWLSFMAYSPSAGLASG